MVFTNTGAHAIIGATAFTVDGATPATIQDLRGTATNDDASVGGIGEYAESLIPIGSVSALTSTVAANLTSINLTAGDWDVEGNINYVMAGATVTQKEGGLSDAANTLPTDGTEVYDGAQFVTVTAIDGQALPLKRFSLSVNSTIYIVAKATFAAGTVNVFGGITARRPR